MRKIAFVVLLAATACMSTRFRSATAGCSENPPSDATPLTSEQVSSLAGKFRVTQITTSFASEPAVSELELLVADSVTRARASERRLGHSPRRDLRLTGTWRWNRDQRAEPAEWDGDTLFLGCRDCLDGSPERLRVRAIAPAQLWGSWVDYQIGIVRVFDRNGKELPNPAGYFCATRISGNDR